MVKSSVSNTVKNIVSNPVQAVKSAAKAVVNAVTHPVKTVTNAAKSVGNAVRTIYNEVRTPDSQSKYASPATSSGTASARSGGYSGGSYSGSSGGGAYTASPTAYTSNGNATSYFNSSYQTGKTPSPGAPRIEDIGKEKLANCSSSSNNQKHIYDRKAAVEYAKKWSDSMQGWHSAIEAILGKLGFGRNGNYYSYGTNCANFVSQVLEAGGIPENDDWHSNRSYEQFTYVTNEGIVMHFYKDVWDITESWRLAQNQYDYFSDPNNGYIRGEIIEISTDENVNDQIAEALQSRIQPGDLMYFLVDEVVHHATVISNVDDSDIFFSGNTRRRFNKSLREAFEEGNYSGVYIVRINDTIG